MALVPLYDLTQQFQNKNGSILVAGKLFVYYIGRPDLATTWADDGASAVNPNPILLDNNGRAPCFVDDSYSYTLVVCDRNGQELFSQDITPGGAGSVGGRVVYHDETLSGTGTVSSLLGVVNIPLGVDDTMTAYTGVVDNKDALILGVNGDWFNTMYSGMKGGYVTKEEFSACCSAVKGGLDNKLDASAINNYYTKTEVDNRTSSFVNYNFLSSNYYTKYETSALFQDRLTFGYDENSAISSINNSALAGGQGEFVPWISGAKILAGTQTLTDNMIVQVLSSFTLSGNKNHCIAVKGGVYRFPNKWEIASGIAETNYFMPQSSMSGYFPTSSFNSFIENGWNPNINALYSSASNLTYSANWLFNNKLDISAFSAWSAVQDPVLIGDSNITAISSKVDNHTQWNLSVNATPVITDTRLIGDNCITAHTTETSGEWIVGLVQSAYEAIDSVGVISSDVDVLKNASGNYYPMTGNPSGFLTEHQDLSYISGKIDDKLDTTALETLSGNFYPMTGNPSGFLTSHQSLTDYYKKTETSSKEQISAAIAAIPSIPTLSGGEGVQIVNEDGKTRIDLGLSAGSNMSLVYDQETNTIRLDSEGGDLSNYYTKTDTSSKQEISAALQYISSNAGKTYTGVDPIQVNNSTNEISITGEALSAGPNIDIFASGGYVVISATGGNSFPITGTNGTTGFTANMDCSSMYLSTGAGPAGAIVHFDTKGVHFEAYPATDVSASWFNLITQYNNATCSSVKLTTAASENWFYTSALPNLNKITFIAPSYGPYPTYSALIDDGDTTFVAEVDSGCCVTVVRCWNDDRNKDCWCGLNQETYFYIG